MPVQIIENGPRNQIVKITGVGAESGTLFDATTLPPGFTRANINRIWSSVGAATSIDVLWDATTDVSATVCSEGVADRDFTFFGGLVNPKTAGWTGTILYNVTGAGAWSATFHLIKH